VSILLGGSGSTGSSLLRRILNRHPDIFSGPELNFFNKEQLFEEWNKFKKRIFYPSMFLPTRGWFPHSGTRLLNTEYGWNKQNLKNLVKHTSSILEFTNEYYNQCLKNVNKKIWIEKTPSNSLGFKYFLETFNEGKVVHLIRNPYDTVASFTNRGFNPIIGAGMYIYNNSMALRCNRSKRYYLLKYENLVQDPVHELQKLFDFLGLEFNKHILFPEQNELNGINKWKNQPNQPISASAVNRFNKTPKKTQNEIVTALTVFQINKKHIMKKGLNHKSCYDLCKEFQYDFKFENDLKYKTKILIDYNAYYIKKCIKLNPTIFKYPGKLYYGNKH
jgi:hypothetical protein